MVLQVRSIYTISKVVHSPSFSRRYLSKNRYTRIERESWKKRRKIEVSFSSPLLLIFKIFPRIPSLENRRRERKRESERVLVFFFFLFLEFNFVAGDWGVKGEGGPAYNIAPRFPLSFSPSRRVQFPLAVSKYFPVISEMAVARRSDFTARISYQNSLFSTRRREISSFENNQRTRKCSAILIASRIKERCPR